MDDMLKILLCEDDENLGMLLREYLQAKGYAAELCPDGEAGYKAFLKEKFDICVLDVMMPKKDGFTLAQEIRQANADIPIIFLTAKTLKEDILEGFKIGADDYITKPFSMEELVFRIEAIPPPCPRQEEQGKLCIPHRTLHLRHTEAAAHHRRQADKAYYEGERASRTSLQPRKRDSAARFRIEDNMD